MNLFDRIFKLHQIFAESRYPIPFSALQARLECSRATVNRCIRDMRNYLRAPIEFKREANGYHYAPAGVPPYELPGLWFNASELYALLAFQKLLAEVQPGLLEAELAPFRQRIEQLLRAKRAGGAQISKRVRILGMASRKVDAELFQNVADALIRRKRLSITYHSRSKDKITNRMVSVQRLAYYRNNWYLDAWDHAKRALRSFAVERIKQVELLGLRAKDIPETRLDNYFAAAYGIFAGKPKSLAILRFSPERSRWVAEEMWHPKQKGRFEKGCYILEVPYSDSRELVMDILKHMPHVEVLGPVELQAEVTQCLEKALQRQKKVRAKK